MIHCNMEYKNIPRYKKTSYDFASKPQVAVSFELNEDKTEIIATEEEIPYDHNEYDIFLTKQEEISLKFEDDPFLEQSNIKYKDDNRDCNLNEFEIENKEVSDNCERDEEVDQDGLKFETEPYLEPSDIKCEDDNADYNLNEFNIENKEVSDKCERAEEDKEEVSSANLKQKMNKNRKCQENEVHQKRRSKKEGPLTLHCQKCGYETKRSYQYRRHIQVVHEKGVNLEKHACPKCDFQTIYKQKLALHIRRHEGFKIKSKRCTTCGHDSRDSKNHVCDPTKLEIFICYDCGYRTTNKNFLRKHIKCRHKVVPENRKFKCNFCEFATKYKEHLETHIFRHTGTKKFECDQCDYKTCQKGNLKRHRLVAHDSKNASTYECYHCNYQTYQKYSLVKHVLKHNKNGYEEAKTHKCPECDFRAVYPASIKCHLFHYHKSNKIPIMRCDRCDFITYANSALKKHQRTHKPKRS